MTITNRKNTVKENTRNAPRRTRKMTPGGQAAVQSGGKKRAKPGTKGEGDYYRIILRSKGDFESFRYHDVGRKGHILRLAGKRSSGSWDTHAWLISKDDAHLEGDNLVADTEDARKLIESLETRPELVEGDVFKAKDRPNIPENKKPTPAQQKAWLANIKKAQLARRRGTAKKSNSTTVR
ncbi:MAG: hypothetical protein A2Z16_10970 [Chloroflexi bacterium RBG_16_54_18]|nr:MAG: hypothetical protein A2Z16_10970 [Chloroflexi bacterium RBG_16_54_18]